MGAVLNDEEWAKQFTTAISEIHGRCGYVESSEMLRKLVKTGLLKYTDLQERPERFFQAHRLLLSPNNISEGSGFGVRFTVQFNLFAGTILGLGSEEQVAMLGDFQERGVVSGEAFLIGVQKGRY